MEPENRQQRVEDRRRWLSVVTSPWIVLAFGALVAVGTLYNVAVRDQSLLEGVLRALVPIAVAVVATFLEIHLRPRRAEQSAE